MNKPRIYYSSPINGAWGQEASSNYMRENCKIAIENVKWLKEYFPEIDWYSPAEHDEVVQNLFSLDKITYDDILEADFIIVEGCQGLLAHRWEESNGVDKEWKHARGNNTPTMMFNSVIYLKDASNELTNQIEMFVDEVIREVSNESYSNKR